jgi:hypothetical protein
MVGCLQVQPVETIGLPTDVQSQVGRGQVPVFFDAAPAAVSPLGERLLMAVPAQAGLGQGSGVGVVLVEGCRHQRRSGGSVTCAPAAITARFRSATVGSAILTTHRS